MGLFDNLSYAYYNTKLYTPSTLGEYQFSTSNYNLYSPSTDYSYSLAEKYYYSTTPNYSKYTLPTFSTTDFNLKSTPLLTFKYTPSKYNFSTFDFSNSYSFNSSKYSYTPYQSRFNFQTFNNFSYKPIKFKIKRANTGDLQLDLAQNAYSYVGKVNSDKAGNRLFSNGVSQAWCADFVTYVTKQTFGDKLPSSFGSSSVSGLRSWAENNGCYIPMTSSGKQNFIKTNVRVGDIMVEKRNGKSHTGIVKEIAPDGSWFKVVEGNSSNKVQTVTYAANSSTLSGFISLDKYCA